MPKILDNVKERIIETARQEILQHPDHVPSLRYIASQTNIAVGTIYNYFSNKEALMVEVLIDDWEKELARMDEKCAEADDCMQAMKDIAACISDFYEQYMPLFAGVSYSENNHEMKTRHVQFRTQIQERIDRVLDRFSLSSFKQVSILYTEALIASVVQKDIDSHDFEVFTRQLFHLKEDTKK